LNDLIIITESFMKKAKKNCKGIFNLVIDSQL
jgi:hypothetical protein